MIYDWDWDNIKNTDDKYKVTKMKIEVFEYEIINISEVILNGRRINI